MLGSHTALPSASAPNCSSHLHQPYSNSCHPERSEGSAFVSSLFSPFNFKLSTLNLFSFLDALDAASTISPLSATLTKNTRGWGVPSFSVNSVPSALKSTRALPSTDPLDALHYPLGPKSFTTLHLRALLARRIRTSAKRARNPFRIRTSKTHDLKLFRMNTYIKTPGGGGCPRLPYSLLTTHYSLLSRTILL
jgi:hypothetical protein